MAIERRIILEGEEICSPPDPEPPPPRVVAAVRSDNANPYGQYGTIGRNAAIGDGNWGAMAANNIAPSIIGNPHLPRRFGAAQPPSATPPGHTWTVIGAEVGDTRPMTFNEFFERIGIPARDIIVACAGCGEAGQFDANFPAGMIQCLNCGRTVPFSTFKQEFERGMT